MTENAITSAARQDALTIVENWHAEFAAGD